MLTRRDIRRETEFGDSVERNGLTIGWHQSHCEIEAKNKRGHSQTQISTPGKEPDRF